MNKHVGHSALAVRRVCAITVALATLLASTALALPPNGSFSVLYSFQGEARGDGSTPLSGLTLVGSTLFGTTLGGGSGGAGTVFRINSDGSNYGRMHEFAGSDGRQLAAGLAATGTTLYGVTENGGMFNRGELFQIDTTGSGFNVLHNFMVAEGWDAKGRVNLVGNVLYGTANAGGVFGGGAIFSINPDGTNFTTRHHFQPTVETFTPWAGIVSDGAKLYGTAQLGGAPFGSSGAVFSASLDGSGFTQLHTFTAGEGVSPLSELWLAGTTLYGTTLAGGAFDRGTIFRVNTDGTGFQTLYDFARDDGWFAQAGVTLVGSTLYGTTEFSGSFEAVGGGIAYRINTDGTDFRVIHRFAGGPDDGYRPYGELVFDGSRFFGTTAYGGNAGAGTVFTLAVPEPATIVLLAPVLAACVLRRRRTVSR